MKSPLIIARKEIRLLFKSKRRILLFFMVPIMLFVVSLVSLGVGAFFLITQTSDGPPQITFVDHAKEENSSLFILANLENNGFKLINRSDIDSPTTLLANNTPPEILVYFPANFSALLNENSTATFFTWYNDKEIKNEIIVNLISSQASSLNQKIITEDYGNLNLNRVKIITRSTATAGIGAGEASGLIIIPMYMLIFFVVPPTTLILISITQEREQKTLESLLLQPIKRKNIVIGKITYGLFLVMSNLVVSALAIVLLGVFIVYLAGEYFQINVLNLILPLITTPAIIFGIYLVIGLTFLSFLLISIAVFFSLIAKDEREGNMVISLLMIFPVFAIFIIYAIPIQTFDLLGQVIVTGLPIIGFLFAIYISLLSGGLGLPAFSSLVFQLLFCGVSVLFSAKIIEMEGILEVNLSQAFLRFLRRG